MGTTETDLRRVLVVDADTAFASSLETGFRATGFSVEPVSTAAAAIAMVQSEPPALVVLDLELSDKAAVSLVRKWKHDVPALPVVLVSNSVSMTAVVEAMNEGAVRFFPKPVAGQQLLAELGSLIGETGSLDPNSVSHRLGAAGLQAAGVDRFFSISPGLLAISGFDGYFKMLNPAWTNLLGYSTEELCARPYIELIHPDDRSKARDEAFEIRSGHTVFCFKNRYRGKDGRYHWLEWCATPSPAHRATYGSARDVTKTVELEQRLFDSNERLQEQVTNRSRLLRESIEKLDTIAEVGRAKDELSALLVHDLKNPLAVIIANYEYLVDGVEGSASFLEALQDSRSAGRRMLRLLENLVDVGSLESGSMKLHVANIELGALFTSLIEQRRILARVRRISVELVCSTQIVVTVDTDLLTRVVENIFDNAIRYTPSGGCIEIELREEGPHVDITIGNTGVAIAAEARDELFEKYGRAEGHGRMSLGLGLYFCRLPSRRYTAPSGSMGPSACPLCSASGSRGASISRCPIGLLKSWPVDGVTYPPFTAANYSVAMAVAAETVYYTERLGQMGPIQHAAERISAQSVPVQAPSAEAHSHRRLPEPTARTSELTTPHLLRRSLSSDVSRLQRGPVEARSHWRSLGGDESRFVLERCAEPHVDRRSVALASPTMSDSLGTTTPRRHQKPMRLPAPSAIRS